MRILSLQMALWTTALWSKLWAILQTPGIALQYTFWQFLTPISSSFVRNPGQVLEAATALSMLSPVGGDVGKWRLNDIGIQQAHSKD